MRTLTNALLAVALVATVGCGKSQSDASNGTTSSPSSTAATTSAAPTPEQTAVVPAKPAQHIELEIASVANTMTFDKTKMSVPAGAEVHLTIKNNATMATLPHNWALVKPGTEASVAAAGLKMGEPAGYFDVRDKDALAHSPMAKPGETAEVTFTAPSEPGDYPYICTFPGHYMMMKGVLTVTP